MSEQPEIDLAQIRARLEARRKELQELTAAHHDEARPVELDQARVGRLSRVDAMQAQAMAQETERRRQLELDRIASALERIEAGTFGECVRCGEPIAPRRLTLDPATPVCVDCAARER